MFTEKPPQADRSDRPLGFLCKNPRCMKDNDFSEKVFTHWAEPFSHTCECGAKYSILKGHVELAELPEENDE